jgi:cytoskeletal protein RodZ
MKLDRIISVATLAALLVAIFLLVKKSSPTAQTPQAPAAASAESNTQSSSQKTEQTDPAARPMQPTQQSQPSAGYPATSATLPQTKSSQTPAPQTAKADPHVNSDAVTSVLNKVLGASAAGLTPDSNVGEGAPNIKDQKVTYDGDTVHGQFLTEIAGKDVWITISGHMGQKDGYATFDPTEFKVGDMEVPVSLVNPALQRKLAEERDRLKLSEPAK